jgi:hypothetical protein
MTAMSQSSPAELAMLLSELEARVSRNGVRPADASGSEAMALYFVATRLVELQLQLLDSSPADASQTRRDLAVTRDVLVGTRSVLLRAIGTDAAPSTDGHDARDDQSSGTLRVVGGRQGKRIRRRNGTHHGD